jgi:hypothetical protein
MERPMRKERASKSSRTRGYLLNELAHGCLMRSHEHLELLARLTAARIIYDAEELELSQDALMRCFQRLANDLNQVLRAARFQR